MQLAQRGGIRTHRPLRPDPPQIGLDLGRSGNEEPGRSGRTLRRRGLGQGGGDRLGTHGGRPVTHTDSLPGRIPFQERPFTLPSARPRAPPAPTTAIAPSRSVRSTAPRRPAAPRGSGARVAVRVVPARGDQGEPRPHGPHQRRVLMRGPVVGDLETSTGASPGWTRNSARCAGGSRSPRSSRLSPPAAWTSSATLASLGPSKGPRSRRSARQPATARAPATPGPRSSAPPRFGTDHRHPGRGRRPPYERGLAGRLFEPRRLDRPHRPPRNAPGSPATWSAWKWVSTSNGTRLTPSSRRQRSTGTGSGPASTTTAESPPAASTVASPAPPGTSRTPSPAAAIRWPTGTAAPAAPRRAGAARPRGRRPRPGTAVCAPRGPRSR